MGHYPDGRVKEGLSREVPPELKSAGCSGMGQVNGEGEMEGVFPVPLKDCAKART